MAIPKTMAEVDAHNARVAAGKIKHETHHRNTGLCPAAPKPVGRMPLDGQSPAEKKNWYDAARRFEIRFVVYSVRPADWDGYDIKFCQDFLVKSGILPDDKWSVLFGGTTSRKAATEGEQKTIVEITTSDL